jgi:DNA repair protein RadC
MTETTFWEELRSGKFAQMVKEESRGREVSSPGEVYNIVKPLFAEKDDVERIYCIFLDTKNKILAIEEMFSGSILSAMIYPRELAKRIIALRASAVVMTHNHPCGSTEPSPEDKMITRKVAIALESIDVRLHDHIIIGNGFHSMAESGFMEDIRKNFNKLLFGKRHQRQRGVNHEQTTQ